jgi:arginase
MGGVTLIGSPYDTGRRGWRMGRGPLELLGSRDDVQWVAEPVGDLTENGRIFALAAEVGRLVAAAEGLPLVVAGNCSVAMAQVGRADGIVWLDAHADFHTPKTTLSGFVDGMALTLACGQTWTALRERVPGHRGIDPHRAVLVGARDIEPAEEARIAEEGLQRADAGTARAPGERTYLHIDLDVLDPDRVGRVNEFAFPGGLDVDDVLRVIDRLRPTLACVSVTAWDPALDEGGRVREAAQTILAALEA